MIIPKSVEEYCNSRGLENPRPVETCGVWRALATHPKDGVVIIPGDVFRVEIYPNE